MKQLTGCEVQNNNNIKESCGFCGTNKGLFYSQSETLQELFEPEQFEIANSANPKFCSVCLKVIEKLGTLNTSKKQIKVEMETVLHEITTGLGQRSKVAVKFEPDIKKERSAPKVNGYEEGLVNDSQINSHSVEEDPSPWTKVQSGNEALTGTGKDSRAKSMKCSHAGCNAKFKIPSQLHRHENHVHKNLRPFVCYFCKSRYKDKRILYQHIRSQHLSEKPWNCPIACGFRTANRASFLTHIERLHPEERKNVAEKKGKRRKRAEDEENICSICDKKFSRHDYLRIHAATHQEISNREKFSCNKCGKSLLQKCYLNKHALEHEPQRPRFPCPFSDCPRGPFISQAKLRTHVRGSHAEGDFTCKDCGKKCKSRDSYKSHRNYNKACAKLAGRTLSRFSCSKAGCRKSFTSRPKLKEHILRAHEVPKLPHSCEECKASFKQRKDLESHMAASHGGIRCRVCDKKVPNFDTFAKHLKQSHADEKEKWALKCSFPGCKTTAVFRYMLRRHEGIAHNNRKLVDCYFCKKKLTDKSTLERHMKNRHLKERTDASVTMEEYKKALEMKKKINSETKLKCKLCFKVFKTNQSLQKHFSTHLSPSQRKKYPCKHCSTSYLTLVSLQHHLVADHGKPGIKFPCPYKNCRRPTLTTLSALKKHIKVVHKTEKRVCEDCGAELKSEGAYKNHKLMNKTCAKLSSRPEPCFACPEAGCRKNFSSSYLLRRHKDEHQ